MKILLIDDEEDLLAMTARRLGKKGIEVVAVIDLVGAREAFHAPGARFDAIVSDLFLGAENGLSFFEAVTQAGWQGPFILVTGDEDGDPRVRAFKGTRSNFRCLQKPYAMDDLINLLKSGAAPVAEGT